MTQEHNQTTSQPNQEGATPPGGQSQPGAGSSAPEFRIPDEYKDRGWVEKASGWKSHDDLFKAYDNAQTLIGKRPAGIPTADASDADWDNFYKAAGRPDEAKYEFGDIEGLPEGFDTTGYKQKASEILHSAGLNQKQADKVYKAWLASEVQAAQEFTKTQGEKEKALDAEFDKIAKEHFGDRYDAVVKTATDDFSKYVPQSLKESFEYIAQDPKALAAVAAYADAKQAEINKLKAEYGAEGTTVTGEQASGQSIDSIRDELSTLRTSQAAKDFTHPDNKKTMERIGELSSAVSRHYKSK